MPIFEKQQKNKSIPAQKVFVEAFNKVLVKQQFKYVDVQKLQDPEKVSSIWVKNLGSIINKMNNTKSLIISMKSKDEIKLGSVRLDKTCPEDNIQPEDGLYRYLLQPDQLNGD